MSCTMYENWSDAPLLAHERSSQTLENVDYWQTEKAHFWQIDEGTVIVLTKFAIVPHLPARLKKFVK